MKIIIQFFCFVGVSLVVSTSFAHNKVTVIPLNTSKRLANVIAVSVNGGDFSNPVDAIASISTTGVRAPSETNPYLIVIGPGVYTLTEPLVMKTYVSISGAGQDVTTLQGTISGGSTDTSAVVIGTNNVTLSDLTIKNIGGGPTSIALYNNSSSPVMKNVTLIASGGTSENYALLNKASSPELTNVTATASVIPGTSGYCIAIANSSNSSPLMTNITATSSGATTNWGISNGSSSPTMKNVTVNVSEGLYNTGVQNDYSTNPIMRNVDIIVSGGEGSYNNGIQSSLSNLTLTNVKATASGGTQSYGFSFAFNIDTITSVYNSFLEGSTNGINYSSSASSSLNILNSSIVGGLAGDSLSQVTCVNSNNGVDKELDGSCTELP